MTVFSDNLDNVVNMIETTYHTQWLHLISKAAYSGGRICRGCTS